VNTGSNTDGANTEDAARFLMADLIRLKRMAYFSKGFIECATRIGAETTGMLFAMSWQTMATEHPP
jgi:hypothetical protein